GRLHKPDRQDEVEPGLVKDLARLYAPTEGPTEMDARFESALQERRATQPNSRRGQFGRPRFSPRWGITGIAVVAVALAAAVVAVALPSGGRSTSIAEAQAFLAQIPDRLALSEGQVLHLREEIFERHGPKAEDIVRGTGIPTERYVRESWQEIGPNETITRSLARIFDASGNLVQEWSFEPGKFLETDPQSGAVREEIALDEDGALPGNASRDRADSLEEALADGSASIVDQSDTYLVLEVRRERSDCGKDLPERIRVVVCDKTLGDYGPGEW